MSRPRTVCVVQARMGSSRLPGKVLRDVGGRPLLQLVLDRLHRASRLDQIVVATSDLPQDQILIDYCRGQGIASFAGSHDDVLDRYAGAIEAFGAEWVVRVTADCPLIDPAIVDRVIDQFAADPQLDACGNVFPLRTFPRGLDVEVLRCDVLRELDQAVIEPRYREHVTLAMYESPGRFRVGCLEADDDYSHIRWTVDEPADLRLIREMVAALPPGGSWTECLARWRERPDWHAINGHVQQKAA